MLIIIPTSLLSQSYVFCPEIRTEPKNGLEGLNIFVAFKDSRVYEKKLVEKCTKDVIFSVFVNCIAKTYPDVNISILDENSFDQDLEEGTITLTINLLKYDATFYPGVYIANTSYEATLIDNRDGRKIFRDTISGSGNQFNALGNKSAKIASNSSFKRAFEKLILMLENLKQPGN